MLVAILPRAARSAMAESGTSRSEALRRAGAGPNDESHGAAKSKLLGMCLPEARGPTKFRSVAMQPVYWSFFSVRMDRLIWSL